MAEECTDSSVGTSSSTPPNWWPDLHGNSLSSWNNLWHNQNPNSNSSCEEDVSISTSFTNASNHSGLTVESSRRLVETSSSNELIVEHASENNLWSHVLLSVGTNGELQNNQDTEGNFDDALSSKSLSTGIFEPACDYLRKLDNSWGFTDHSTSFNNFDKHINGFSDSVLCNERLTKLSDLVSTWSIAPPDPDHVKRRFDPQACNISLSPSMDCYSHLDQPCDDHMKQTFVDSTSSCLRASTINSGLFPSTYGHDLKLENERHESETPLTLLRRSFNSNEVGYQIGLENSFLVDKSRYYNGMPVNSSSGTGIRSFADVISFSNRVSKQGLQTSSLQLTDSTCAMKRVNTGKGQTTIDGKRKKSEDGSGSGLKKPKHECATASSVKTPKVKLTERITTLQQIVSPFGKTDTASVLFEAIQYIKFLQEQVQLLSNPYLKSSLHVKLSAQDPWGGFDRKEKGHTKPDLRSRGLCLVPISCTPQIYRENTGSDYWSTPTYRGCLYG